MYDILPFPNITATDTKEQVAQINNYLIQFKEDLEFVLMNIGSENLSTELKTTLFALGADIKSTNEEQTEHIQQVANKMLTVSDVINSEMFKAYANSVDSKLDKCITSIEFSVDYETGELLYKVTRGGDNGEI